MSKTKFAKPGSKPEQKPIKSRIWLTLFLGLILLFVLGFGGALYVYDQVLPDQFSKQSGSEKPVQFEVPTGAGINQIANKLETAGLIKNALLFRLKGKMADSDAPLKAGEYKIAAKASIDQIFEQMQQGRVIQHSLTIAEGLTSRAILRNLERNELLTGDIGQIPPEGSLLPETYYMVRGTTRKILLARMKRDRDLVLAELWEGREPGLPIKTAEEAMILASIVEKETGVSAERQQVAAVFINRLRKGMRLESDPTILYGLNGGQPLGRGLRRSEIDRKTAWNTYQIDGLPPTAICNPGREAIYATLHPAKTKDLYFVADGSGGHAFAKNYAGHLVNVAKWRRVERARRRAGEKK